MCQIPVSEIAQREFLDSNYKRTISSIIAGPYVAVLTPALVDAAAYIAPVARCWFRISPSKWSLRAHGTIRPARDEPVDSGLYRPTISSRPHQWTRQRKGPIHAI